MKNVNEYTEGYKLEGTELLINNVTKGASGTGSPYLSLTLQDNTGSIVGKKWDASDEDIITAEVGKVIKVYGDVIDYRGNKQIKVVKIEEIDQNLVDISRFCIPSPVSQEKLESALKQYINTIKNEDAKKIVTTLIDQYYNQYVTYPAAKSNHHEFMSGLLYHTLSMAGTATLIASRYDNVNKDILISGVLLHDLGKVIELSGPVATQYTFEGKLLGHISIVCGEIRRVASELNIKGEVPVLLEHMVLSHHGKQEFGSPVLPMTKEALILSTVDDLDAKMNILDKAYENVEEGEFTSNIKAMDGRSFYKSHLK